MSDVTLEENLLFDVVRVLEVRREAEEERREVDLVLGIGLKPASSFRMRSISC